MRYQLQMSYIPSFEQNDCFLIWFTDQQEQPISVSPYDLQIYLRKSRHLSFLTEQQTSLVQVQLENGDDVQDTEGLLVPMFPVLQFLQQRDPLPILQGSFILGESFAFWHTLAQGLGALIENGHYLPTFFPVEYEDKQHIFAQWMINRKPLHDIGLYRTLLQNIPEPVLSPSELGNLPLRQWFDYVLDTCTDQLIRKAIAPSYERNLSKWPKQNFFDEWPIQWFYYLTTPENAPFNTVQNSDDTRTVYALMDEVRQWHADIYPSDTTPVEQPNPLDTLRLFKQHWLQNISEPVLLFLCVEPQNETDPFRSYSQWDFQMQVKVKQNGREDIIPVDQLLSNNPYHLRWLHSRLRPVAEKDDRFYPLLLNMYGRHGRPTTGSTDMVIALYKEHADLLARANIELRFPHWFQWEDWSQTNVNVDVDVELDEQPYEDGSSKESMFGLSSLLQFNWRVSVGDLSLSIKDFQTLVEEQQRFLQHNGQWIELPLEQMQQAYQELQEAGAHVTSQGNMGDALRLRLAEKHQRHQHLQVNMDQQADRYLKNLSRKPNKNVSPPSTLQGELRPYQKEGYAWLRQLRKKGVGACLADDMGLGKTIQTIAYMLSMPEEQKRPVLIVCPTSLIGNWKRELEQFAPHLRLYTHHGPNRWDPIQFEQNMAKVDCIITSYALALRDADWLEAYTWSALILDEAQAIKNPMGKQSRTIRHFTARHRVALTGTPMENNLKELWSIMDFINPGYLGAFQKFQQQFITPIEKHDNKQKAQLLKRLIQPFLLRREKTDTNILTDLPDKVEQKQTCVLTKEQASLYQGVVDDLLNKMRTSVGIERKGLILGTLTKLKQVCDHPSLLTGQQAHFNHSGKMQHLRHILDPVLARNEKTLLFTQYVEMGHLLQRMLQEQYTDCPVFFLHGGLPAKAREKIIDEFRTKPNQKGLFILSLKAGGLGLNLTEANHVIHYDRWWNPAVEDQATDRTYRIGQHRNVHVYKLISEGTLEENIDHMIDQKRNLTEQIIGQGEGWITELNDEEVYELIRLRAKVVS